MKFTAIIENFNTPLWTYHIKVPLAIADHFLDNGTRRVYCKLNGKREFQCAIMPAGDNVFFILVNKKLRERLKLTDGTEVNVTLRKDDSKYGLPMPEELQEVLNTDQEGNDLFQALTPGKKRSLLHIVGTYKTTDLKIKKSLVIIDHLKMTGGKVLFKQLGESLKQV